jgi:superfamily II DNA or RNA helicase
VIELRDYQRAAIDSIYAYFERHDGHPLLVLPTGAGKSIVLAAFVQEVLATWPKQRIMMLTHVKELIAQNADKLLALWPRAPLGIFSAGLKSRDTAYPITFAGIQSVYRKPQLFGHQDLVIIDEAHLVAKSAEGMYRDFLGALAERNPALKVIGLTATPYRLRGGMLHQGDERLFTHIAYDLPVTTLIDRGYLCPLVPKQTTAEIDTSSVHSRAGEFIARELEAAAEAGDNVAKAVEEIVQHGQDRRSWLVFCVGVSHAEAVTAELRRHGVSTALVLGETPAAERDQLLGDYKAGRVRALVNVGVLTTGFDAPETDLLAVLRPTQSTGLYVQIMGRGMRTAPGKDNCIAEGELVLTDAGLVPIESVQRHHRLWDGEDWVYHDGVKFMGTRPVVSYAGLIATEDHRVWTEEGWKTFGECAIKQIPIAETGVGRVPVRESLRCFRGDHQARTAPAPVSDDGVLILRSNGSQELRLGDAWHGRLPSMREPSSCTILARQASDKREAEMHERELLRVRAIRGARDRVQVFWANGDGCVADRKPRGASRPWHGDRPHRQQRPLRAWQSEVGNSIAQCLKHAQAENQRGSSCVQDGAPGCPVCRRHAEKTHREWTFVAGDREAVEHTVKQTERRVWDVLNAGPRHRFTVSGLLVSNCLVLDFGGNVRRHGPIDRVSPKGENAGVGEALAKACPECATQLWIGARECTECGYQFPEPEPEGPQHDAHAATDALISTLAKPVTHRVDHVGYCRHEKPGKPPSLRVEYVCGLMRFREWVCLEHTGFARHKAERWWMFRSGEGREWVPDTVEDALAIAKGLRRPATVTVTRDGQYDRIASYGWNDDALEAASSQGHANEARADA